jgi:hypothetical protein
MQPVGNQATLARAAASKDGRLCNVQDKQEVPDKQDKLPALPRQQNNPLLHELQFCFRSVTRRCVNRGMDYHHGVSMPSDGGPWHSVTSIYIDGRQIAGALQ